MHCHPAPECECDLKSVIGIPFSPAQKIRCGSLNPPPTRRINLPIMNIWTSCQQKLCITLHNLDFSFNQNELRLPVDMLTFETVAVAVLIQRRSAYRGC